MTASKVEKQTVAAATPPPFRPDPEIIGNIEGNDRIRRKDQASARAYLREHDLRAPADDPAVERSR